MQSIEVYGADHSPWVQAVLLGLHDAGIPYSQTSVPPLRHFFRHGVLMPAARIDGGEWQLESADILHQIGYSKISRDQMRLVQRAWQGVSHRTDSAALFWGAFSTAGDAHPSPVRRLINNFLRSFITFYMFLLIRSLVHLVRVPDPENFGDQFLPFEDMLANSDEPYLAGDRPDTLDFLLFGIIQCHSSVYVPPVTALQKDPRLAALRDWIGRMQARFQDYGRVYSGIYFAPHCPPPEWASRLARTSFWLGAMVMFAVFPITVVLVVFLVLRNRRRR